MSCAEPQAALGAAIPDDVAAAAFRRLLGHLDHRRDARNVDLMGLAGFCRNCLSDWVAEASAGAIDRDAARGAVYGMDYTNWKAAQPPVSEDQLRRMAESMAKNVSPPAGAR